MCVFAFWGQEHDGEPLGGGGFPGLAGVCIVKKNGIFCVHHLSAAGWKDVVLGIGVFYEVGERVLFSHFIKEMGLLFCGESGCFFEIEIVKKQISAGELNEDFACDPSVLDGHLCRVGQGGFGVKYQRFECHEKMGDAARLPLCLCGFGRFVGEHLDRLERFDVAPVFEFSIFKDA